MKQATALALDIGASPGVYAQHASYMAGLGLPVKFQPGYLQSAANVMESFLNQLVQESVETRV